MVFSPLASIITALAPETLPLPSDPSLTRHGSPHGVQTVTFGVLATLRQKFVCPGSDRLCRAGSGSPFVRHVRDDEISDSDRHGDLI